MAKNTEKKRPGNTRTPYSAEKLSTVVARLRTQAATIAGLVKGMSDHEIEEILVGDAMLLRSILHIDSFTDSVTKAIRDEKTRKGIL